MISKNGYERSWLAMGRQRGWRVKTDGDQVFITAASCNNLIYPSDDDHDDGDQVCRLLQQPIYPSDDDVAIPFPNPIPSFEIEIGLAGPRWTWTTA